MIFLSSCTDALHTPMILIISRCCLAEDGEEMYKHVKRTCKACSSCFCSPNRLFCGFPVAVVLA